MTGGVEGARPQGQGKGSKSRNRGAVGGADQDQKKHQFSASRLLSFLQTHHPEGYPSLNLPQVTRYAGLAVILAAMGFATWNYQSYLSEFSKEINF